MRDFANGGNITVGRDFFITDQSQQHKLLIHCTSEELMEEDPHRRGLIADERTAKLKRIAVATAGFAFFLLVAAVYCWTNDQMDFFQLFATGGSFVFGLGSLRYYETPNEFEQRQLNALKEIDMLLRERSVR